MIDKRSMRDQLFRDCMDTFLAVGQFRDGRRILESLAEARGTMDVSFGDKLDRLMNLRERTNLGVYGNAMNIMAPKLEIVRRYALDWRVQANKIRY